jgi:hypothetical protein
MSLDHRIDREFKFEVTEGSPVHSIENIDPIWQKGLGIRYRPNLIKDVYVDSWTRYTSWSFKPIPMYGFYWGN